MNEAPQHWAQCGATSSMLVEERGSPLRPQAEQAEGALAKRPRHRCAALTRSVQAVICEQGEIVAERGGLDELVPHVQDRLPPLADRPPPEVPMRWPKTPHRTSRVHRYLISWGRRTTWRVAPRGPANRTRLTLTSWGRRTTRSVPARGGTPGGPANGTRLAVPSGSLEQLAGPCRHPGCLSRSPTTV